MLPSGVVKGGSAIKLRLGDGGTRFTTDLDVARSESIEAFEASLRRSLEEGWEGFTGRLVSGRPARPKDVPSQYVMQPFEVKLSYRSRPWCTVKLEVGHNEIGDADEADYCLADDVADIFEELGFPRPDPVALMKLHHQVAQKLHALTEPGSRRAHDLIDLQLLMKDGNVDYGLLNETCVRLFAYRRMQPWPSLVEIGESWPDSYKAQSADLPVFEDAEEAVRWVNSLISMIEEQ